MNCKFVFILIIGVTSACFKWKEDPLTKKAIEHKWDMFENCDKVCKNKSKNMLYIMTHHSGWCYYCDCKYFGVKNKAQQNGRRNTISNVCGTKFSVKNAEISCNDILSKIM